MGVTYLLVKLLQFRKEPNFNYLLKCSIWLD